MAKTTKKAKSSMSTKRSGSSFWITASQAPAAISLVLGFLLVFAGILFPSVTAFLLNIFGFILIFAGIISIYLLGGVRRQQ